MTKKIKNISASVHDKLLNLAKARKITFGELLQFYGLERFLYRLSISKYKTQFILKGALMFLHWTQERARPTRDIDLLSKEVLSSPDLVIVFTEICKTVVSEDGVIFDPESIKTNPIRPAQGQNGVRITFLGFLGKAEIPIQVDVAYGDVVVPSVTTVKLKSLLGQSEPVLQGYSVETAVAEKFHAITKLGLLNSRLKDYFDIWYVFEHLKVSDHRLMEAIRRTFKRRNTLIPTSLPEGFSSDYLKRNKKAWDIMLKRNGLIGPDFGRVIQALRKKFKEILSKVG